MPEVILTNGGGYNMMEIILGVSVIGLAIALLTTRYQIRLLKTDIRWLEKVIRDLSKENLDTRSSLRALGTKLGYERKDDWIENVN